MWRINRILILLFSPFCAFPFNLDFSFTAKHFTEITPYIYYLPSFHGIMIWTNFKLHYMGMLPHTWFLRRFLQIFKLYMFLNKCKIWQPHWIMIWTNIIWGWIIFGFNFSGQIVFEKILKIIPLIHMKKIDPPLLLWPQPTMGIMIWTNMNLQ